MHGQYTVGIAPLDDQPRFACSRPSLEANIHMILIPSEWGVWRDLHLAT